MNRFPFQAPGTTSRPKVIDDAAGHPELGSGGVEQSTGVKLAIAGTRNPSHEDQGVPPRWVSLSIVAGAGCFIFALLVSAIFDPTIRLLHLLQALIYVAVIVLTRKSSPWGFGPGFTISLFWNYINLFVTTFIAAGLHQLWGLLSTGHLGRPDLLIAVIAAGGHVLLIVGCAIGFLRRQPSLADWGKFVARGVLAVAYFALIIVTTGPQYSPLLKRVFRIGG